MGHQLANYLSAGYNPHLTGEKMRPKEEKQVTRRPHTPAHVVCGGVHTQTRGPHGRRVRKDASLKAFPYFPK